MWTRHASRQPRVTGRGAAQRVWAVVRSELASRGRSDITALLARKEEFCSRKNFRSRVQDVKPIEKSLDHETHETHERKAEEGESSFLPSFRVFRVFRGS